MVYASYSEMVQKKVNNSYLSIKRKLGAAWTTKKWLALKSCFLYVWPAPLGQTWHPFPGSRWHFLPSPSWFAGILPRPRVPGGSILHPHCFLGRCPSLRVANVWPWVSLCLSERWRRCHHRRYQTPTCIGNRSTSCVFSVSTLIAAFQAELTVVGEGSDLRPGCWDGPIQVSGGFWGWSTFHFILLFWQLWSAQTLVCSLICFCRRPGEAGLPEARFFPPLSQQHVVHVALKASEQFAGTRK